MPAAVFVTQSLIRKRRDRLRPSIRRFCFTYLKHTPSKFSRFRDVDPINTLSVAVKLNTVRIMQPGQVRYRSCKLSCTFVPAVEYVNRTAFVIGQVVQVRDEDPAVPRLRKKTHAFQSLQCGNDLEIGGQIQRKASPCFCSYSLRYQPHLREYQDRHRQYKEKQR